MECMMICDAIRCYAMLYYVMPCYAILLRSHAFYAGELLLPFATTNSDNHFSCSGTKSIPKNNNCLRKNCWSNAWLCAQAVIGFIDQQAFFVRIGRLSGAIQREFGIGRLSGAIQREVRIGRLSGAIQSEHEQRGRNFC